jgi:hypothetical protein
MTMTETARPLKNNTYAVTSGRGIDEWGLYFEFVQLDATLSIINYYCRVFVAGSHVSFYERKAQTARTTWKPFTKATPEAAREYAVKLLQRGKGHNVMRGSPLLVQLEPADIETMEKGKSPGARYRATARHEALFGKLEVLQDAKPGNMDFSGVQPAIERIGAAPTTTPTATPAAAAVGPTVVGSSGATATIHPPPEPHPTKETPLSTPIDWNEAMEEPY